MKNAGSEDVVSAKCSGDCVPLRAKRVPSQFAPIRFPDTFLTQVKKDPKELTSQTR